MPRKRTHSFNLDTRGPRLQRVLADAGYGSRRACEELIENGSVKVNGEVVDALPAWVDPTQDRIVVDGKALKPPERHVYIMLFKPRGVVSTNSDPEGRVRAIDLVKHPANPRLYPVGRLDLDSSGLLLLTNDGDLANRLTHPRYEVHKGYEVTVGGSLTDEEVAKLEAGIFLHDREGEGKRTRDTRLSIRKRDRERTMLYMELREGRNRQVRRMLLRVGHPVKKLRRIRMGPLELKGLAVGEWRELTARELQALRRAARGEKQRETGSTRSAKPRETSRSEKPRESTRGTKPREASRGERPRENPRGERPRENPRGERPRESTRVEKPRESRSSRGGRSTSASRSARPSSQASSRGGRTKRRTRD
jgi:pseudouridine synthase